MKSSSRKVLRPQRMTIITSKDKQAEQEYYEAGEGLLGKLQQEADDYEHISGSNAGDILDNTFMIEDKSSYLN